MTKTNIGIFLLAFLNVMALQHVSAETKCPTTDTSVEAKGQCLVLQTYKSEGQSKNPSLSIVLHGDAPFSKPSYQYMLAKRLAAAEKNHISVGLLRPGYTDSNSRTSDGERGLTVGDNYDDARVSVIASAVMSLKEHYHAGRVTLIGHSGGAAIAAKILALHPEVAESGFLVSCPCDVKAWRRDMYKTTKNKAFSGDIGVSSPIDLIEKILPQKTFKVVVGKDDKTAKPYLSKAFFQALKARGVNSEMFVVPGGHDILNDQAVFDILLKSQL